jgi:2-hydroxy-6-oxonona-2,4-dienedioate hydrolase
MGLTGHRIDVDGVCWYHLEGGPPDAPVVVLVHGAAVSSRHMAPVAEVLAGGFRVLIPDLIGHGRSDDPASVLGVEAHATALAGWLDRLGHRRIAMLGNSYGCQIITAFAVARPDRLVAAVLQGPTPDPAAGTAAQVGRWVLNTVREGTTQPSETFRQWSQAGPRVFPLTTASMLHDRIAARLGDVRVPTLVVSGDRDPITPPRWAREAAALLPRGEHCIVPDATHTMTVADPDALAEVAGPFLSHAFDGEG